MFLRRKLEPKPFHALYFPGRKDDRKVLIGDADYVWPWFGEEVKHVDLSDFDMVVAFPERDGKPPARTSDNLPCSVKATFWIRPRTDAKSISKATERFAATTDLKALCSSEYFKTILRAELGTKVRQATTTVSFMDLLGDAGAAKNVEQELQKTCKELVEGHGFELLGFDSQVDVIRPDDGAFTENLRTRWDEYQQRREQVKQDELRRANANRIIEESFKIQNAAELAAQAAKSQEDTQRATNLHDVEIQKLLTSHEAFKLEQKRERDRTAALADQIDDATKRRALQYKLDLDKFQADERHAEHVRESERAKALAVLQEAKEKAIRASAIEKIAHEIELARHQAELAQGKAHAAKAEADSIEILGMAEARVLKEKMIAEKAAVAASNEALLDALPGILEKSVAPAERLGAVRYLHIGGQTERPESVSHSGLFAAISTLPVVREVLSFIREWDREGDRK